MSDYSPRKGMTEAEIASTVTAALKEATLEEKVAMMSGKGFYQAMLEDRMRWSKRPYRAGGGCERLGIPALYFTDGPRGVARGNSTCFPVSMARGASWDRNLERRIGDAMGVEVRAQGCNLSGAVCVNILRHPGWGRAQETYGEDPYHVGEMGKSLSQGIQTHNVIATVKHFAVNSIENTRFEVDVRVDGRSLREVYLPHFKRILDSGCASVMSSYNKLNGEYCGQHRELLTNILRGEWGFDGFVHSDWIMGVYHPYGAVAGLDIENPEPACFGERLIEAVKKGHIEPSVVDTACRRILTTLYRFMAAEDPYDSYPVDFVACREHVALAREAAEKSAVLLSNNGVLPLSKKSSIGVFGKLAEQENTGDNGSSKVRPPYVATAIDGLSSYLGQDLGLLGDESDPKAAAEAAKLIDIPVLIVGNTAEDEGEFIPGDLGASPAHLPAGAAEALKAAYETVEKEDGAKSGTGALGGGKDRGGDREMLRLREDQVQLIEAVTGANPNSVVVIVSGSAILSADWIGKAAAVLQTFYAGMEGGNALARLLFGDISPSGKLPFTVALHEDDYPYFDKTTKSIEYGPLHGYTLMAATQTKTQFEFGYGLSYSSFEYRAMKAYKTKSGIWASISIKNIGSYDADEIAQLYVSFPDKLVARPAALLRGFERIHIKAGETKTLDFVVPLEDLKYWDENAADWRLEAGEHVVFIGPSSCTSKQLSRSVYF